MPHYRISNPKPLEPTVSSVRHTNRRTVVSGLAAAIAAGGLIGIPAHETWAQDYPPTDGEMQGFVLLKERKTAPDAPFFDLKGNVRHFTDFGDKVLLLNFWATWCGPCIREMPSMSRLQDAFPQDEFRVLTVTQDRKGLAIAAPFMVERLGIQNLGMFEDRKLTLGRAFGVRGLPTSYLIDRQGLVVGGVQGSVEWDSPDAKAMIRHLLRESI